MNVIFLCYVVYSFNLSQLVFVHSQVLTISIVSRVVSFIKLSNTRINILDLGPKLSFFVDFFCQV